MSFTVAVRVQKHRLGLRASGLRPVQIWVPDTRRPGFAQECRRQSSLVSQADAADAEMMDFLDKALSDVSSGTP
jgi:hypothetical protein